MRKLQTVRDYVAFAGTVALWGLVAFTALCSLIVGLKFVRPLLAAGISPAVLWSYFGIAAVTALIFVPPLFARAVRAVRIGGAVGILAIIAFSGFLQGEWEARTPEGQNEHQREVAQAQVEAGNRIEAERALANATRLQGELDDMVADQRALRRCGRALAAAVRGSLHNPRSFEHVDTEFGTGSRNARLTFRAENGFGAIRTATVEAKIDPASCDIIAIDDPQTL